jgi:predicted RNase H-like HicB family nuclease
VVPVEARELSAPVTTLRTALTRNVLDLADRSRIERELVGAIRSVVDAHGPLTRANAHSAAKRAYSSLKAMAREQQHRAQATEAGEPLLSPEEYAALPYHIVLVEDRNVDGNAGWFAEVEELPGCMSQGRTPTEAVEHVRDAILGWTSVTLEDGNPVPRPAR